MVTTYGEVRDFMQVGSPFSIPKAALVLAGFQPGFSTESYVSLEEQLKALAPEWKSLCFLRFLRAPVWVQVLFLHQLCWGQSLIFAD